jgi:hypothetical protein
MVPMWVGFLVLQQKARYIESQTVRWWNDDYKRKIHIRTVIKNIRVHIMCFLLLPSTSLDLGFFSTSLVWTAFVGRVKG